MVQSAQTIWRDWDTDGVPASGPHQPAKREIRDWSAYVDALLAGAKIGGAITFTTAAQANASLAYAPNQMALVVADGANSGVYQKKDVSGFGFWLKIGELPYSFARYLGTGSANAIVATSAGLATVTTDALLVVNVPVTNTSANVTIAFNGGTPLAIKTSSGNNPPVGALVAGMQLAGYISGSTFRLISDISSAAIQAAAEAAAASAASYASLLSADKIKLDTVAALQANTSLSYTTGSGLIQVSTGNIIAAQTFPFRVAASGATDQDITTAGGVKLYADPMQGGGLNILQFGCKGDNSTDNATMLAKAISVAVARKLEIVIPPGNFRYSGTLDLSYPDLRIRGVSRKTSKLICTSAGRAADAIESRPNNGAFGYTWDVSDVCFEGNANTTENLRIGINHGALRNVEFRIASPSVGTHLRVAGSISTLFDNVRASSNSELMGSNRALVGVLLDVDDATGRRASNNTFVNCIFEGMIGDTIYLKNADHNLFLGGTGENNDGNGVTIDAGCQINTFVNMGFENRGYANVFDKGQMSRFINCYGNKLFYVDNSARFCRVEGGYWRDLEVAAGASFVRFQDMKIRFFSGSTISGGYNFHGNQAVECINIFDVNVDNPGNEKMVFPSVDAATLTPTGSGYVYTNNTGREQMVVVSGGSGLSIELQRAGVTAMAVPIGAYSLRTGDGIKVTYTSAPQMVRLPGGFG